MNIFSMPFILIVVIAYSCYLCYRILKSPAEINEKSDQKMNLYLRVRVLLDSFINNTRSGKPIEEQKEMDYIKDNPASNVSVDTKDIYSPLKILSIFIFMGIFLYFSYWFVLLTGLIFQLSKLLSFLVKIMLIYFGASIITIEIYHKIISQKRINKPYSAGIKAGLLWAAIFVMYAFRNSFPPKYDKEHFFTMAVGYSPFFLCSLLVGFIVGWLYKRRKGRLLFTK